MKKITIFIVAICTLFFDVSGQESANKPLSTQAYFGFGTARQNIDQVNDVLYENGLPLLSKQVPFFSYGGSVLIKNLILGGQGNLYFSRNYFHPGINLRNSGGSGEVYGGYILVRKNTSMFYPIFGIGYGGGLTEFLPTNGGSLVLENEEYEQSLQSKDQYMILSAKVNFDTFTGKPDKPRLLIGLSLGYEYRNQINSFSPEDTNGKTLAGRGKAMPHVLLVAVKIGIGTFKIR